MLSYLHMFLMLLYFHICSFLPLFPTFLYFLQFFASFFKTNTAISVSTDQHQLAWVQMAPGFNPYFHRQYHTLLQL